MQSSRPVWAPGQSGQAVIALAKDGSPVRASAARRHPSGSLPAGRCTEPREPRLVREHGNVGACEVAARPPARPYGLIRRAAALRTGHRGRACSRTGIRVGSSPLERGEGFAVRARDASPTRRWAVRPGRRRWGAWRGAARHRAAGGRRAEGMPGRHCGDEVDAAIGQPGGRRGIRRRPSVPAGRKPDENMLAHRLMRS